MASSFGRVFGLLAVETAVLATYKVLEELGACLRAGTSGRDIEDWRFDVIKTRRNAVAALKAHLEARITEDIWWRAT